MLRKFMIAFAAAGALGFAASTGALAEPHGHFGQFGGGHFGGGHFDGGHFDGGHFGHWGGPGFGFRFGVGPGYAYDYDYGYDGCYQLRRFWTPIGWRLHRVYVCG